MSVPSIIKAVKEEKKVIEEIVKNEHISGIISDNRFGLRSTQVPSVYITHQLNVLSGSTTSITSILHQKIIAKFDECWVPDKPQKPTLSGKLSVIKKATFPIKFIGALSRFEKQDIPLKYDLLIVLSGPEPQRSILEEKLVKQLQEYPKKVLLVRGIFTDIKPLKVQQNITVVNYMLSTDLERAFNESNLVVARSGYSTILDLHKLEKKAFFIPTPGQFEQEYLAQEMAAQKIAPYEVQDTFELKMLDKAANFLGYSNTKNTFLNSELFNIFNR